MKNTTLLALATVSLSLAFGAATGCGSSTNGATGTGGTTSSSSSSTTTSSSSTTTTTSSSSTGSSSSSTGSSTSSTSSGGNPAPPTIGMQLDRMGRPAINTALNHAFDGNASTAGTAKDTYNADSTVSMWSANYAAQFAGNLAIIDALDGTCGNQFGYGKPTSATSYNTVAGAMADDRLYLNTAGATHAQYLAVEANVLGVANTDQGGRTLSEVVMDTTYSVLAAGALTGVSNGITMNDVAFSATFPYEAAPH
jgi:hypothetical protein